MIDVSHKKTTLRYARAMGKIFLNPETIQRVKDKTVQKGDVGEVARSAGILAAKRTPDWMVFCHSLPLDWAEVRMEIQPDGLQFTSEIRTVWKTGLEMEAMVAVSAALLNAYDMLKPIQGDITIGEIRVVEKTGGKSDTQDEFPEPLKAAILTVSSAKKEGKRKNRSADAIRQFLAGQPIDILHDETIEENPADVENLLKKWADSDNLELIFISGASGPQKNGFMPEMVRSISDKNLPGLAEAMRHYGFQRTPFAMLSDQTAGLRGRTLMLSLPGSSRGAEESLHALFPGVLHLFKMLDR